MKRFVLGLMAATAMTFSAYAQDIKPGLLFDLGGKFDKSFNESSFNGAEKFKTEAGIEYREYEIKNEEEREQALRRFAEDGNNPIVMAGFSWSTPLAAIAKEFPETNFTIIDSVVEAPNVRSVVFKDQEGSYLVGIMGAMASKTKKVGFVGGMNIPLISAFGCGYVGGAKSAGATQVFENMIGDTPEAWGNKPKATEIAKTQMDQGADVIYAAAGGAGLGALEAAADGGKLGIGVDSNQDHLFPGKVLTSMLKRVDVAVYNSFNDAKEGKFTAGVNVLGLADGGIDYAMDDNNKPLVDDAMKAAVEKAKADIIAGTIQVHDFRTDNKCPY